MLLMGDTESKFNVHLLLDTNKMTWVYGPDNQDDGWMGQGQSIIIDGEYVVLSLLSSDEGEYSWDYYKQKM